MPIWLTFFVALFATGTFFFGLYAVVIALVEGRRFHSRPQLGVAAGESPGTLSFWVNWNPSQFDIQVYRIRAKLTNPFGEPRERTFTVTLEPPQKSPFIQSIQIPEDIRQVIETKQPQNEALFTADFRTVEEFTGSVDYTISKLRKIYGGAKAKVQSISQKLATVEIDPPAITSLEYSELVVRRKKLKDLEEASKAKAAKAAPLPAAPRPAESSPASTAPPSTPVAQAAAAAPQIATPAPASAVEAPSNGGVVPSIKSVIAQDNAKKEGSATKRKPEVSKT